MKKVLLAVLIVVELSACASMKGCYPEPRQPGPCDMNYETKTYNDPTAGCDAPPADAGTDLGIY